MKIAIPRFVLIAFAFHFPFPAIGQEPSQTAEEKESRKSASANSPATSSRATDIYRKGLHYFEEQQFSQAAGEYQKAADLGNPNAQHDLGLLYLDGRGVERNDQAALKLFREAASQDYTQALISLGVLYATGRAVEKDEKEAVRLYLRAAERGDPQAQSNLGLMYYHGNGIDQSIETAVSWFLKAANQGFTQAQYNLGVMHERGRGVEQDKREAFRWYLKAAHQGYADAQNSLANFYRNGVVVEKDDPEANRLYLLAAEQGHPAAQRNLGLFYEGEKNMDLAIEWYEKSVLHPDQELPVSNALAWIYATSSDPKYRNAQKAVSYGLKAISGEQDDWASLDTMAAAYARSGDFEKAVATQNKVIQLLTSDPQIRSASDYEKWLVDTKARLDLYTRKTPYSE